MINNNEVLKQIASWEKITKLKADSLFIAQLEEGENLANDANYRGHMTASGLIVYRSKILLIRHNKLKKWLQPGGHLEPSDLSLAAAAEREIEEETGLKVKLADWHIKNNLPIMIDTHPIPEHKGRPAHFHHDFRYIFLPETDEVELQLEEVEDFAWVGPDDPRLKDETSNAVAYELAKRFGILD